VVAIGVTHQTVVCECSFSLTNAVRSSQWCYVWNLFCWFATLSNFVCAFFLRKRSLLASKIWMSRIQFTRAICQSFYPSYQTYHLSALYWSELVTLSWDLWSRVGNRLKCFWVILLLFLNWKLAYRSLYFSLWTSKKSNMNLRTRGGANNIIIKPQITN
jgi:hypothetical protein